MPPKSRFSPILPLLAAAAVFPVLSATAKDSAVVINEVMYHPPDSAPAAEWVELRCLHGVDVDISGWELKGGINYTFPLGTIIKGRSFLVVAENPSNVPGAAALGPWVGRLSNGGESLRLVNNSGREMDRLEYSDDGDWPVAPDGSGATLARKDQTSADDGPAAWISSNQVGGTPGTSNFLDAESTAAVFTVLPIDASNWKYQDTNAAPAADWKTGTYDDAAWGTGRALFYHGTAQIAAPVPPTVILSGPGDGLVGYWAMDDAVGSLTAANSAAGGTVGTLNGTVGTNVAFTTEAAPRSKILRVNVNAANANVSGSWVAAGSLPPLNLTNSFTWAFWAKSNVGANSSVILGNRYANNTAVDFNPREFIKFTTSAFEWHVNGAGQNIDYADITAGTWMHHVVVKQGPAVSYYRNGVLSGSVNVTAVPNNAQPFFMGGNGTNESWAGWLDDVALWSKALPAAAITQLATNVATPATVPTNATLIDNGPFPIPAAVQFPTVNTTELSDAFAGTTIDTAKWAVIDQGLEQATPSSLSATQNEQLTLAGTTTVNYWSGKSLRTVATYSTGSRITAEVDRVSLTGTGTAFRSSLWLWADAEHYLHFSQNMNEGGWSWNANDVGGTGTLIPTGAGNNIGVLDFADANGGACKLKLVWIPGAYPGNGTIQIWRDTTLAASHSVTNWPANCQVMLTGQARQAADTVSAVFDNAQVTVGASQPLQTPVNQASTHYFRNKFTFTEDPLSTSLSLWPIHDDAAVYYLNGIEIHRDNISATPSHSTFSSTTVAQPSFPRVPVTVPAGALLRGENVLAVEVHQDSAASPDMLFGAQMAASVLPAPVREIPALRLTELAGATDAIFRVELQNTSNAVINLTGYTLRDSAGQTYSLSGSLAAGQYVSLDQASIGWRPLDNARLFLMQGSQVYDARIVTNRLRGLTAAGVWGFPTSASFGAPNVVVAETNIVINEIMSSAPNASLEQWVEIYNRGASAVDVSGWKFADGISYEFPANTPVIPGGGYAVIVWDVAAFQALHPGVARVFGPFSGSLSGKGERLRLRDAAGNLADEVRYADGGTWPQYAMSTSSSLELRNALADNSNGAAWAASDETSRGTWQNVSYTFPGTPYEVDLNYYSELILGLLNDGEVLVDDISVRQDPTGANIELMQNGNFSVGTADKWRFAGNTRRSVVVDDPTSAGNKVLKLVQNGSLDHMSNHAETTLKNGATLLGAAGLPTTVNYTISFRARWWKGSNALNSHLYFNRGATTTLLPRPTTGGTPGAVNSTASATATLTLSSVMHSPAVPAANTAAVVKAKLDDPSNTAALSLIYAVNEGAEQTVAMTNLGNGLWQGSIPGQAAAAKANFRIQASTTAGHATTWPTAGMAGRAIVPWADSRAMLVRPNGCRPHNVRIVMTNTDTTLLHAANNVMSNDFIPCTVIYDEQEVYYGTKVHLKGSEHGRAKTVRAGFLVQFPADNPFLGRHDSIAIDRSGAGDQFSQKEMLVKRSLNRAGGIPCTEDDLIHVISPQAVHTGPAICVHARLDSDEFLDGQWSNGSNGTFFEYELLYPLYSGSVATSTDNGTLEGMKLTQDGPGPPGVGVRKLNPGLSKEEYRWYWLIKNNRSKDNYTGLIAGLTALGQAGLTFHTQTAPLLDTNGWLRSFTGPIAWAVGDNYAYGSQHNCLFLMKADGKLLYVPWDMDFTSSAGSNAAIVGNGELGKMVNSLAGTTVDDVNRRTYYNYLLHMVDSAFNPGYLGRWMDHYSCFVNEDYRAGFMPFVTARETFIRTQITAGIPSLAFQITTNSGNNYVEANSLTTLSGDGWVNVASINLTGGEPLALTWTDQDSWTLQLPVLNGPNVFTLEARNVDGTLISTDSITVTGTSGVVPASSENIVVTEVQYHPAVPGQEFLELFNPSSAIVDLSGCTFTAGIAYTFPAGTRLSPGARLLLVESRLAFLARYPTAVGLAPGEYAPSSLQNSGETVTLLAANGLSEVFSFTYSDDLPATDGGGSSLVRKLGVLGVPTTYEWRQSMDIGGNPGSTDAAVFIGNPLADADMDGHSALIEYAFGTSDNVFNSSSEFLPPNGSNVPFPNEPQINADSVIVELESSEDLVNWQTQGPAERRFWRIRVRLR